MVRDRLGEEVNGEIREVERLGEVTLGIKMRGVSG